ncbi:hypothetical protein Q9966_014901 [Columba livia]|nr:hypothetical protein Q9966_014901 [Columba livia]
MSAERVVLSARAAVLLYDDTQRQWVPAGGGAPHPQLRPHLPAPGGRCPHRGAPQPARPAGGAELPLGAWAALPAGDPPVPPVAGGAPRLGAQFWGPPRSRPIRSRRPAGAQGAGAGEPSG